MALFPKALNLWVSLPRNDVELAKAAVAAGADAIKVHIAVEHVASGNRFGTLEEEAANIEAIVKVAEGRPVGLVAGGSPESAPTSLEPVRDLGISFISIYAHHCPARWLDGQPPVPVTVAPNYQYPRDLIKYLPRTGVVAIEGSVIPQARYGEPLTAADLAHYHFLRSQVDVPIVLPSQLRWTPADVPALAATGVNSLMIGALVTGQAVQSLAETTAAFRKAIDER